MNVQDIAANGRRWFVPIVLITGLCLAGLWWFMQPHGGSVDARAANPVAANGPDVAVVNGVTIVSLDPDAQVQSGIASERLGSTSRIPETVAYGVVLDLQPLIDLRSRYVSAQSDDAVARAAAAASHAEAKRLALLYRSGATSLRDYQAAEAADQSNQARVTAAALTLQNIQGSARQQFGETIAHWLLAAQSPELNGLLDRQTILVRVTFPPNPVGAPPSTIQIAADDRKRIQATFVSGAAQS
ncbi:MAG: hypothetical protein ACRD9W_15830, partial [Terriglobia bacterium]